MRERFDATGSDSVIIVGDNKAYEGRISKMTKAKNSSYLVSVQDLDICINFVISAAEAKKLAKFLVVSLSKEIE